MQVSQVVIRNASPTASDFVTLAAIHPGLVLAFGSVDALRGGDWAIAQAFPGARRVGCTTASEISQSGVGDSSLVVTALQFDATQVEQVSTELKGMDDSFAAGQRLASGLAQEGLRAIPNFGQGVAINGSALLSGMTSVVGVDVPITVGLADDGGAFQQTWVLDDGGGSNSRLACVGLYGAKLEFSHGSFGGWSPFGPARKVTRCENNVLYELDGESALAVYKRYLDEHASGLPASGLLFPFAMVGRDHSEVGLIRTILGVDEAAAQAAMDMRNNPGPGAALLLSCVGRKLVMVGRVDEEIEAVGDVFGTGSTPAGFYSYGEISPFSNAVECKLHNQTMTITYLSETA